MTKKLVFQNGLILWIEHTLEYLKGLFKNDVIQIQTILPYLSHKNAYFTWHVYIVSQKLKPPILTLLLYDIIFEWSFNAVVPNHWDTPR